MSPARLALAWAFAIVMAAAGCVRLADPPATWLCTSQSDCPSGERCSAGVCIAAGECAVKSDCSDVQRCETQTGLCVGAECHSGNPGVCGRYACVDGLCKHDCDSEADCILDSVCAFDPDTFSPLRQCLPRPKGRGEACATFSECEVGLQCCTFGVCGYCFTGGVPCNGASDCDTGYCCPGVLGRECAYAACSSP